ncbi:MAG: MerR family transcriptional regulator [Actinomycetota bacterium]|nr:MerR family transcriptional regulator [Actinomycetota bacterium]
MEPWQRRLADEQAPLYTIGVVAELLDVSVQVVRRYDGQGFVQPERTRSGQRRYSRADIGRLARVLRLAAENIPVSGIMRILELEDRLEAHAGSGSDR